MAEDSPDNLCFFFFVGKDRLSTFILPLDFDYKIVVLPEVLFVCLFFVVVGCISGEFHWCLLHNYPPENRR